MRNNESKEIEGLVKRLQQHEEIITQLLEIIAVTNRQVVELTNSQKELKHLYMLH